MPESVSSATGFGDRVGRVAHHDPLGTRRVEVDVVQPHPDARDHAQLARGCQDVGIERLGAGDQRVDVADELDDLVLLEPAAVRVVAHLQPGGVEPLARRRVGGAE